MKAPIPFMELCPSDLVIFKVLPPNVELVSICECVCVWGGYLLTDIFQLRKLMNGTIKKLSLEHR